MGSRRCGESEREREVDETKKLKREVRGTQSSRVSSGQKWRGGEREKEGNEADKRRERRRRIKKKSL